MPKCSTSRLNGIGRESASNSKRLSNCMAPAECCVLGFQFGVMASNSEQKGKGYLLSDPMDLGDDKRVVEMAR